LMTRTSARAMGSPVTAFTTVPLSTTVCVWPDPLRCRPSYGRSITTWARAQPDARRNANIDTETVRIRDETNRRIRPTVPQVQGDRQLWTPGPPERSYFCCTSMVAVNWDLGPTCTF